jgi:hypothetical protein
MIAPMRVSFNQPSRVFVFQYFSLLWVAAPDRCLMHLVKALQIVRGGVKLSVTVLCARFRCMRNACCEEDCGKYSLTRDNVARLIR